MSARVAAPTQEMAVALAWCSGTLVGIADGMEMAAELYDNAPCAAQAGLLREVADRIRSVRERLYELEVEE